MILLLMIMMMMIIVLLMIMMILLLMMMMMIKMNMMLLSVTNPFQLGVDEPVPHGVGDRGQRQHRPCYKLILQVTNNT